jgi:hypothetical protein
MVNSIAKAIISIGEHNFLIGQLLIRKEFI